VEVSLEIPAGAFVAVVGPNGAGKSTLMKLCCGFLAPEAGVVEVHGAPPARIPDSERGSVLGYLPQSVVSHFPFTCREIVEMGRPARRAAPGGYEMSTDQSVQGSVAGAAWRGAGATGALAAAPPTAPEAKRLLPRRGTYPTDQLSALGVAHLASRPFPQVSLGEQRLVLIAKMLAQDPDVLLLDEPNGALDLAHSLAVMSLLSQRARSGRTVVAVLHDLNLALAHCSHVALMQCGSIKYFGPPSGLPDSRLLEQVYCVDFATVSHPRTGSPVLIPSLKPPE